MRKTLLVLVLLFQTQTKLAQAFWIGDHAMLTQKAVLGLQNCGFLPQNWDQNLLTTLVNANRDEDLNLFRKWTYYSHYYNPYKVLNMRRADSSVTIHETTDSLMKLIQNRSQDPQARQDLYELMGRAIHHIQDATVPAHVTPISHFNNDGFEAYDVFGYEEQGARDVLYCKKLAELKPNSLQDILYATAVQTLSTLDTNVILFKNNAIEKHKWSEVFWVQDARNNFGTYGLLKNNFGTSEFSVGDDSFYIAPTEYDALKAKQYDLAILTTQEALLWMLRNSPYLHNVE